MAFVVAGGRSMSQIASDGEGHQVASTLVLECIAESSEAPAVLKGFSAASGRTKHA